MPDSPAPTAGPGRALRWVLGTSALLLLALQCWRPCFFLTDDSLTQYAPLQVEILRHFLEGKPILTSAALYGGGYAWSGDLMVYPLLSPFAFACGWIVWTPWPYAIVDLVSSLTILTVAASFTLCGHWLRRRENLPLSDGALALAALSYAWAPYHLLLGSSWLGYLSAQAAWPPVLIAFRLQDWRRAILLLAAAFSFATYGGSFHPLLILGLSAGLLAVVETVLQRTLRPLIILLAAGLILLASLVLILGDPWSGVQNAMAVRDFGLQAASHFRVAPQQLLASLLAGPLANSVVAPVTFFEAGAWTSAGLATCLIALPAVVLGLSRRPATGREWILLTALALLVVCIARPVWLERALAALPVLRSLRWPFREVAVLLVLLHWWFLHRWHPARNPGPRRLLWAAAAVPLLAWTAGGPPTFGLYPLSRRAVFAPQTEDYWRELRPLLGDRPLLAMADPPLQGRRAEMPLPLLAGPNFSALYDVTYASGYSTTTPLLHDPVLSHIVFPGGFLVPTRRAARYLQLRPETNVVLLHSLQPAVWSLHCPRAQPLAFTLDENTMTVRRVPLPPR